MVLQSSLNSGTLSAICIGSFSFLVGVLMQTLLSGKEPSFFRVPHFTHKILHCCSAHDDKEIRGFPGGVEIVAGQQ